MRQVTEVHKPPATQPFDESKLEKQTGGTEKKSQTARVAITEKQIRDSTIKSAEILGEQQTISKKQHKELIETLRKTSGKGGGTFDALGDIGSKIAVAFGSVWGAGKLFGKKSLSFGSKMLQPLAKMLPEGASSATGQILAKTLGKTGVFAGLTSGAFKAWELKDREDLTGEQKLAQVSSTGGGALAGAAAGGSMGAALGSIVPVVGNVAGGVIGSVIGGILGSMGGEKIGKIVSDQLESELPALEKTATSVTVDSLHKTDSEKQVSVLKQELSTSDIQSQAPESVRTIATIPQRQPEIKPLIQPIPSISASAQANQPANLDAIDEKKLSELLAQAIDRKILSRQGTNGTAQTVSGDIQMDFDDTVLTLIAYDRI